MTQPKIEFVPVENLIPYVRNSRTHDESQVAQLVASIDEYGFTNPILIDESGVIIAGHGRVLAARRLRLSEVPCIRLGHLTDQQKRAYVIADNKLAMNAGWDEAMLQSELDALLDDGFDLELVGFSEDELDGIAPKKSEKASAVRCVETGQAFDRFWISVRGPLTHQAEALRRLRDLMKALPVTVELGTVNVDGLD